MQTHSFQEGLPQGLGEALATNNYAAQVFEKLDSSQRDAIISQTKNIRSGIEMRAYVSSIADGSFTRYL